ncbi:MAG TPA: nucleotidyltransferase family protein, partial [Aigarchaeota archaeon]|nr:nucleotidyltransferase family protein [Aigarchaeota archaeon]
MNSIVAAILAGGEGRRFRPYTDLIPKPMVPLGAEEKPLLEYIVNWLAGFGITKFVFLVGYRWRQVANYFGDGFRWGVKIDYSVDDDKYTNTGGALAKALMNGLLDGDL